MGYGTHRTGLAALAGNMAPEETQCADFLYWVPHITNDWAKLCVLSCDVLHSLALDNASLIV